MATEFTKHTPDQHMSPMRNKRQQTWVSDTAIQRAFLLRVAGPFTRFPRPDNLISDTAVVCQQHVCTCALFKCHNPLLKPFENHWSPGLWCRGPAQFVSVSSLAGVYSAFILGAGGIHVSCEILLRWVFCQWTQAMLEASLLTSSLLWQFALLCK